MLLCRIVTDGEKREVWRLTVENVSTAMKSEEKEREQNMYKDVSSSFSLQEMFNVHSQITDDMKEKAYGMNTFLCF